MFADYSTELSLLLGYYISSAKGQIKTQTHMHIKPHPETRHQTQKKWLTFSFYDMAASY
jgi:hypothetical protein